MKGLIYAVTVTYVNRFNLLEQTIKAAFNAGVDKVIVVDNNSSTLSQTRMNALASTDTRIKILHYSKNLGSAGGFKAGLVYAGKQRDCEFIWLLDDDNKPKRDALKELWDYWKTSSIPNKESKLLLNSLRYYDYDILKKTSKELDIKRLEKDILMPNSYSYFSLDKVFTLIQGVFRERKSNNYESYEMPCGAYGGLFIHRDVLKNGLPNEEFVVYFDDTEFTHRLFRKGVRIIIVPSSKIIDTDRSLVNSEVKTYFSVFKILENIHNMNTVKLHYSYRNRIMLESSLVNNKFKHALNKAIFTCIILPIVTMLYYFKYGDIGQIRIIKEAISEGREKTK